MSRHVRRGFTLVELVVVIMILGILATVAVPRFLDISNDASEGALKQSLAVVRDAIEVYAAQNNGQLPGGADDLDTDLADLLRGSFPESPVGIKNSTITYITGTGAATGDSVEATGWKYNKDNGEFICNHESWEQH